MPGDAINNMCEERFIVFSSQACQEKIEMRSRGPRNQEEEFDEDGPSSISAICNISERDGKNVDKINAMRSKHSVTEQKRRSKINERFQILRDLIPNSDQKKDTASFLLEVIEYVQFLQEKVNKYEGSFLGWNNEVSKLMPWRNSHWRTQTFTGNLEVMRNDSGPESDFRGNSTELNSNINLRITNPQNSLDSDTELISKGGTAPQLRRSVTNPFQEPLSDLQSVDYPFTDDQLIHQAGDLTIESGTICIASAYSEGLLSTLTRALETAGIDLSLANISLQIDVGNRANRGLDLTSSSAKDNRNAMHPRDISGEEESAQTLKRAKT